MNRLWGIIVACMLNSCVVSDIGGTIRSRAEQHFSVDRGRPEVVYLDAGSLRRRMLALTLTYSGLFYCGELVWFPFFAVEMCFSRRITVL